MFKLLTDEARKKAVAEYTMRRGTVMLGASIVLIVIALGGLFPTYVLSGARRDEVLERIRVMGESGQIKDNEVNPQVWLSDLNLKLSALDPKLDNDHPSALMEKVIEQKFGGISITGFSWSKDAEKATLLVSGVARDRQMLLAFQNNLNNSGYFSGVTLPISNLAKDKDIVFQVKISPATKP